MTWVPSFKALPRPADELICGIESGPEVVYANSCEAEEAADRRHDFSDHLEPWDSNAVAAWSWRMGPDR